MTEIDTTEVRAELDGLTALEQAATWGIARDLCDALDKARKVIRETVDHYAPQLDEATSEIVRLKFDARNLRIERDAAHREVADRMAEIADQRMVIAHQRDMRHAQQAEIRELRAKLANLDAAIEAFAGSPLPPLDAADAMAVSRVTAAFIARMRAALGGAE